jgi:hypothetical protein
MATRARHSVRRRESKAVDADADAEHAGLLQRDFAHELGAHDLANIKAFHLYRLLLIGCAHYFSGDRVELFARVILRGHVLRFHHYQDVKVLRCSGVAEQDLVIEDKILFLGFLKRAFQGLGELFQVFVSHTRLSFDHRDGPDRAFGIRSITLCRAQACDAER